MNDKVVAELTPRLLCSNCENAAFHSSGIYCVEFREFIYDETVAEDCGVFDPIEPPAVHLRLQNEVEVDSDGIHFGVP